MRTSMSGHAADQYRWSPQELPDCNGGGTHGGTSSSISTDTGDLNTTSNVIRRPLATTILATLAIK